MGATSPASRSFNASKETKLFSILRVCRYVPLVACASVAAFLLGAPASARADDTYAAIAFSPKTGLCGHASSVDSQDKADAAALFNTKADDAKIVVRVKNGWCAMAVGAGKKYGVGTGADADTARKTAVAECKKLTTFVNAPRTSVPENPFDNLSYVVAVPSHVPPGRASAWEFNEAPTEPAGDTGSALSADEAKTLVNYHNEKRDEVKVPHVEWDNDIAKFAQEWADHIAETGELAHRPEEGDFKEKYGECLGAGSAGSYGPQDAAAGWYKEKQAYEDG